MEKNYDETTAINALISVFEDVVRNGKENSEFEGDSEFVDISDGAAHQPIILLDREDVTNLIPFLEENYASDNVIAYLKNIGNSQPQESNKQG